MVLAIARWGELTLEALEARARQGKTASERARAYFRAGAQSTHSLSLAFYADIERFESTRLAWWTSVVERYLDRFVELVQLAEDAGEIRPVNIRFLAEVLRQIVGRDAQRASLERQRPHPRTGGAGGRFAHLGRRPLAVGRLAAQYNAPKRCCVTVR